MTDSDSAVRWRDGVNMEEPLEQPQDWAVEHTRAQTITTPYVDAHLVLAQKPAGVLSVPGLGPRGQDCVAVQLQQRWPDLRVVHRLDMATSGLMVLARGAAAHRTLSMAFERRAVHKQYIAVVSGWVEGESGSIELPLAADWPRRPLQKVDHEQGKPSITRWQVIQRDLEAGLTRLLLEPLTGRSHQLRVHLATIGHPIIGDALYAPPQVQALAPRLLLHASRLAFAHPASGAALVFESAAPF